MTFQNLNIPVLYPAPEKKRKRHSMEGKNWTVSGQENYRMFLQQISLIFAFADETADKLFFIVLEILLYEHSTKYE